MSFLYYLPGVSAAGPDMLRRAGLADRFEPARPPQQVATVRGPDGAAGCVLGHMDKDREERFGYLPDLQTWAQAPGGAYWVGMDREAVPTAADLRRRELIDGYVQELESVAGEPGQWVVPLARVFPTGSLLPQSLALGADGTVIRRILPRFAAACRLADRIWDQVRAKAGLLQPGETVEPMSDREEFEAAATILGLNYRVGVPELGLLGALTTANLSAVLKAFVDWPQFVRHRLAGTAGGEDPDAKKAGPTDEPTASGSPAGSAATCPPTAR